MLNDEMIRRIEEFRDRATSRNRLRLNEVMAVYYRSDPIECTKTLGTIGGMAFLESAYPSIVQSSSSSFDSVNQTANALGGGAMADYLITSAFRAQIVDDPAKAFELLRSLPSHLRFALTRELAQSWGRTDGKQAAKTFYRAVEEAPQEGGTVSTPLTDALSAWAGKEGTGAPLDFLQTLQDEGKSSAAFLKRQFMQTLALTSSKDAAQLASGNLSDQSNRNVMLLALRDLASKSPDKALAQLETVPGGQAKTDGMLVIAGELALRDPKRAGELLGKLPPSNTTNQVMSKAAAVMASKDPVAAVTIAQGQQDPYLRKAAAEGVASSIDKARTSAQVSDLIMAAVSANADELVRLIADRIVVRYGDAPAGGSPQRPEGKLSDSIQTALLARLGQQYPSEKREALLKALRN